MVIIDTNIIIDSLRLGEQSEKLEELILKYGSAKVSISMITVQELFSGASSKIQEEHILKILSGFKIWPYDEMVAKKAGEMVRDSKNGKVTYFADAAIAATCLVNNCQLATLNKKDFEGIKGLELVDI